MKREVEGHAGGRRAAIVALCVLISGLWLGCSERKNYKLLSFFFDGVPNPVTGALSGSPQEKTAQPLVLASYPHKPYEENNCKACHGAGRESCFEATTVDSSVCLQCHQKVLGAFAVMHGPVEARACLWCHAPHGSPFRGMLRGPSLDICLQCHEIPLLTAKVPEHRDGKTECLNCHVGHGSAKHNLLRPEAPTTAPGPTTAPSSMPAAAAGAVSAAVGPAWHTAAKAAPTPWSHAVVKGRQP